MKIFVPNSSLRTKKCYLIFLNLFQAYYLGLIVVVNGTRQLLKNSKQELKDNFLSFAQFQRVLRTS